MNARYLNVRCHHVTVSQPTLPWHSRIILPEQHTFRAFTAELSRIAAFNFAGSLPRALPSFFRASTGHQVGGGTLGTSEIQQPTSRGGLSTIIPFALPTALLVLSLLAR